jgi:hypothetical protein
MTTYECAEKLNGKFIFITENKKKTKYKICYWEFERTGTKIIDAQKMNNFDGPEDQKYCITDLIRGESERIDKIWLAIVKTAIKLKE